MRAQLISAALLAAVAGLPLGSPFATPSARAASPVHQAASLVWTTCSDVPDTECASLDVPVDPARPNGTQLTLRLGRVLAADRANSKGAVLFIPGGPGAGIAETFGAYRGVFHVEELRLDHDVVSFDPRGVGQSNPVRCAPEAVPSAPATGIASPAEFEALGRANSAFVAGCFERTGELMAHLSAMDTAADIEQIRIALGQADGLVAYSGSYGTNYAGAYLERYGRNVNALVLDAVFDHSIDLPSLALRNAMGVEDSFGRFAAWCDGDPACALHGENVPAVFDSVVKTHPEALPVVGSLLSMGRDPQSGWPAIATMLRDAQRGEASSLAGVLSLAPASIDPTLLTGKAGHFRGVLCSDFGSQNSYSELVRTDSGLVYVGPLRPTDLLSAAAPRFGAWKFWDVVGNCVGWPNEAANPTHRLHVGSHPNVLVTSNTHDPATPLVSALAVWSQIPQARMLVAEADGHQALAFSRCAFETQIQFLDNPASAPGLTNCSD